MSIRLKSSSLVLVVISSMPMPVCNRFHERLANNGKITTFMEVPHFDALVRRFRSMLKISYAASPCLSQFDFGAVRSWNVSRSPKSPKVHRKPLFWHSRSSKVIEFGGNREPVYDFLLVINSNLGPISHRYWDTATYWLNITNFFYPLSFNALIRGDPPRIYGKALQFLKLHRVRIKKRVYNNFDTYLANLHIFS